jgi:HIV-1 Vpr-binding protein
VLDGAVDMPQADGLMRQADGDQLMGGTVDVPEADGLMCSAGLNAMSVYGEKHPACETLRGELLKRKLSRTGSRLGGKSKVGESLPESEQTRLSATSDLRMASKDNNAAKVEDPKKTTDLNNISADPEAAAYTVISQQEYEDRFGDCIIGLKDITDIVLKAVRAAEAEARSANAPEEAVKAAGDAAAELVKSAALEVWEKTYWTFQNTINS